jgi:sarcosine oxidase subunit gamma
MSDTATFAARSPLAGALSAAEGHGAAGGRAGITAVIRDGVGFATVMTRRGASDALNQRIRERFGIDLPHGPHRSAATGVAFIGMGPGSWLALAERVGNEFAARLMSELDGVASVSDQSDGYTMIRLSGANVRDALAKLIPIDVDARAFQVGDAASTVASHIGVTVWRLPDGPDSAPLFELILFRSLTRSFWHALAEAAGEYGFAE